MITTVQSNHECPACLKSIQVLADEQEKQNLPLIVAIFSGTVQTLYYDAPDFIKLQQFHKITDKEDRVSYYIKYSKIFGDDQKYELTPISKDTVPTAIDACYDTHQVRRLIAQYQLYFQFTTSSFEKKYWLTTLKDSTLNLQPAKPLLFKFNKQELSILKDISKLIGNCSVLDVTISMALGDSAFSEQLVYLRKAVFTDPKATFIQIHLGTYYLKLKKYSHAREHFQTALQNDKNNQIVLEGIGSACFHLKDHIAAKQHFKTLLALSSTNLSALIFLGHIHMQKNSTTHKHTSKALNYFQNAYRIDPAETSYHLALFYMECGSKMKTMDAYAMAESYLNTYIQLNPNNDVALARIAGLYFDGKECLPKNTENAYSLSIQALKLNPSNEKAYHIFKNLTSITLIPKQLKESTSQMEEPQTPLQFQPLVQEQKSQEPKSKKKKTAPKEPLEDLDLFLTYELPTTTLFEDFED